MTRRAVVILAVLVGTATAVPTPHAAADWCSAIESAFGVTASGDVIEERYCVGGAAGFDVPRPVAEFGPAGVRRLFWGGRLPDDGAHILYAVSPHGELWWFRQDPFSGRLGAAVRVGAEFGDWRQVEFPFATGDGDLYGVDSRGHLLRWVHYGWMSGADVWDANAEDLGAGCAKHRPVYAGRDGPARYVAVVGQPPSYAYCVEPTRSVTASVLPADVDIDPVTAAPNHGVAYALTANDHRLVRLAMCRSQWAVQARSGRTYAYAFTGWPDFMGEMPDKYEWQWAFYGELPLA